MKIDPWYADFDDEESRGQQKGIEGFVLDKSKAPLCIHELRAALG